MMQRDGHAGGPMSEAPLIPLHSEDKESSDFETASELSDKDAEDRPGFPSAGDAMSASSDSLPFKDSDFQD